MVAWLYQKWLPPLKMRYAPGVTGYKQSFVELLAAHEVIRFGEFTLKSGRKSPYFINAGQLRTGGAIAGLGQAYAARIVEAGLDCELVFGPSYKGVPLAVATAMALAGKGRDVGFAFDRKEIKDHGEGGRFVGMQPEDGMRAVVVDDVITSGASIRHSVELLRGAARVEISGVVIAVDRQEKGQGARSTLEEIEETLDIPVLPIVTIRELVEILSESGALPGELRSSIDDYVRRHGPETA